MKNRTLAHLENVNPELKIITINLAEPHVKALGILQDLGIYPSRSEAIRVAIRDFLRRELGFSASLEKAIADRRSEKHEPASLVEKRKEIARLLHKLRAENPELSTVT